MTIATATPEQLALVDFHVVQLRASVSEFARMMNKMNALNISWTAIISSIIGTPAGLSITDSSGLAGTVKLTDTQVAAMMTSIQAILTTYYSTASQQTMVQFCGPTNMV